MYAIRERIDPLLILHPLGFDLLRRVANWFKYEYIEKKQVKGKESSLCLCLLLSVVLVHSLLLYRCIFSSLSFFVRICLFSLNVSRTSLFSLSLFLPLYIFICLFCFSIVISISLLISS